jgi:hypothetical protein
MAASDKNLDAAIRARFSGSVTDHHSLIHLLKQHNLSWQQARWTEFLADFDLQFEYVRGEENTVADSLSRKYEGEDFDKINGHSVACIAALMEFTSTISPTLCTKILVGYNVNPWCRAIQKTLPLSKDCTIVDDLLVINGQLLIPDVDTLRHNLMDNAHQRLGHLGYFKKIAELRQDFFWPKMARSVHHFITSCPTCQRTKAPTTAPLGKMLTPHFHARC